MVRHIGFDPTASFFVKLPPSIDSNLYLPFNSDLNDDSPNALTGTAVGGASISTSVKKFGAGSLDLSSNGQYVTYPDNSAFDLGSDDFTFEAWIYETVAQNNWIFSQRDSDDSNNYAYQFHTRNDSPNRRFEFGSFKADGTFVNGAFDLNPTINTWNHVALVRQGTELNCFLNGVSAPSPLNIGTDAFRSVASNFSVGRSGTSSAGFRGYIDDFRFTKNAVYTSNFTPPTAAVGSTAIPSTPFDFRSTFSVDQMREGLEAGSWPSLNITIRAIGAGGAGDFPTGSRAGDGGYSSAIMTFPIGTQLNIVVGRGGSNGGSTGTLAQGGGGGASYNASGSGGGFSGVFSGSSTPALDNVLQANALVIAGGGGGGGYSNVTSTGGAFGGTAEGGGLSGDNGTANGGSGPPYRWGYGGTQVAGGAGGSSPSPSSTNDGQDGSALQGGDSGTSTQSGGGGGGGWFGGGGGGWKASDGVGGGGGGSGYIASSAVSGSTVLGGAGDTLPASLAGNLYGLTAWYSANHGAVEIIDGNGSTVYTYTGAVQIHTVA